MCDWVTCARNQWEALHAAVKYAVTAVNGLGTYTWRKLGRRQPPGSTPGVSAATLIAINRPGQHSAVAHQVQIS